MGDDTPALQAVLDADVWRKHLLAEQEVGKCLLNNMSSANIVLENNEATRRYRS